MSERQQQPNTLTRSELITALAHYYRAEVQRSLAWRERLDRTTNWAVAGTAAFLGFGFSHPEIPHVFFLFGLAILYLLLFVESRRFRFYDAYDYRIRLLNQHFIYGILADNQLVDDPQVPGGTFWRAELASDLRYPQYKMSMLHAISRRLNANYIYLFAVLLAGWLIKIQSHPTPTASWQEFLQQARIGPLPGLATLGFMVLFAAHLLLMMQSDRRRSGGRDIFQSKK